MKRRTIMLTPAPAEPIRSLPALARATAITGWRLLRPLSAPCRDYDWLTDQERHDRCSGVLRAWFWRGFPCWCHRHGEVRISPRLLHSPLHKGPPSNRCDFCRGLVAHAVEDHEWSIAAPPDQRRKDP